VSFDWPVRVYYEDTDAGGIVYYANYLRFLERARTEWLRSLGFEQEVLRQQGILFVVREISLKYKSSARLDDELSVSVALEKMGKASFQLSQKVYRVGAGSAVELVSAFVTIACIDDQSKPRSIPAEIVAALQADDDH
jgi:tol-pal system-associated acyl-CoA thioesterase